MAIPASKSQGWAIFLATGYDIRKVNMTKEQASEILTLADKAYAETTIQNLAKEMGVEITRKTHGKGFKTDSSRPDFQELYDRARAAGYEAVAQLNVAPMVVQKHTDPLNDNSPVVQSWVVEGGPCGFAWVNIKPGNCSFANWLKKNKLARSDSYYGGVTVWVSEFGQSMARKEAFAYAFAKVISEAGIRAYASSRMD
jgi:fermentation-respiration switch protein FrsA (DUF1100 family)